jgi:sugar O-acyltransferase (sialic acid O-acetyltransferase NeuD family)
VADLVSDIPAYEVAGFAVNVPHYEPGATLLDKPVYWIDDLAQFASTCQAVCAIGSTKRRPFIERVAALGFEFASVIHPSARVSRAATIGEGAIVNAGVLIATHAQIGRHVILNRGALIGHHVRIGDYATVSPGANLAGAVSVGEGAYIGLGAMVLEKHSVGEQSLVGAAALVTRDVPARTFVMGSPARVVEENFNGY